jgi:hypothetical protein
LDVTDLPTIDVISDRLRTLRRTALGWVGLPGEHIELISQMERMNVSYG